MPGIGLAPGGSRTWGGAYDVRSLVAECLTTFE